MISTVWYNLFYFAANGQVTLPVEQLPANSQQKTPLRILSLNELGLNLQAANKNTGKAKS